MPRRVFIGLTEVAGYFGNLQRGFEEIGIQATFVDESGHVFEYRRPSLGGRLGRWTRRLAARAASSSGFSRRLWRAAWLAAYFVALPLRIALLGAALVRHDAFVFSTDTWLPRNLDLPVLKLFRKRIVWTFTGSDHRPPYLDGGLVRAVGDDHARLAALTRKVRRRVAMAERYADAVVALPASAHFHARPVHDFLRIGIPFGQADADGAPGPDPFTRHGVRVLHSPSNLLDKGTDRIRAAIEELRRRGHQIDYLEITGRPHREVLAALRHCDMVVAEVFSDTPMAGLATEAAFFGKPAVVTGYYAELLGEQMPPSDVPPSLYELPERLEAAIERLVADPPFRRQLGERARDFVRSRWSPIQVAQRYVGLLEGNASADLRWDPAEQRYLLGCGMPRELVLGTLRGLVAAEGREALGLGHDPALEARFLEAAKAVGAGPDATIAR